MEARQTTYSDHGKLGWYVGPVLDKYRNYSIYGTYKRYNGKQPNRILYNKISITEQNLNRQAINSIRKLNKRIAK